MVRPHFLLGLIGGVLGLLMTPLNFILSIVIFVLTGTSGPPLLYIVAAGALSGIAGIVGAVLSRHRFKLGGAVMLASGVLPLLVALGITLSFNVLRAMLPLLALYFWTFLLIASGAMSLARRNPGANPPLATATP